MYFCTGRNMVSTTVLQYNFRNSSLPCSESGSISHPDLVNPRPCAWKISSFNLLLSNYSKYFFFQESQGENEGTDDFAQNILQRKKHCTADRDNLCSCIPSCSTTCQKMGRNRNGSKKSLQEKGRRGNTTTEGKQERGSKGRRNIIMVNMILRGVRDLECGLWFWS